MYVRAFFSIYNFICAPVKNEDFTRVNEFIYFCINVLACLFFYRGHNKIKNQTLTFDEFTLYTCISYKCVHEKKGVENKET